MGNRRTAYEVKTESEILNIAAEDVELTGVAAGSPGYFRFTRNEEGIEVTVFVVAAKSVLAIHRLSGEVESKR
jgi:hypothetical protein